MKRRSSSPLLLAGLLAGVLLVGAGRAGSRTLRDARGRTVRLPARVTRVVGSGPGCLRLLVYLRADDRVVAVDDLETRRSRLDSRPYAIARPHLRTLPIFGRFRGQDDPERLLTLDPPPQVVFKTYPAMGHDPDELQEKTGIPVFTLEYGNLGSGRGRLFEALRLMGEVLGLEARAAEVVEFFLDRIRDLERRTAGIPQGERPTVYVGGVAFKGPHGFQSTEPGYPPFRFVGARNVAATGLAGDQLQHADVAREKLLEWDPRYLFLDLSTLQMGAGAGALHELGTHPAYQALTAVRRGEVYGLLPYNWYSRNFGSVLANGYFLGKLLYPKRFADVDPAAEADEIYTFLVGRPVFDELDRTFGGLAFRRVSVR